MTNRVDDLAVIKAVNSVAGDTVDEAFRAFERWCAEHDPDGNMDLLEASIAYSEWADKNSIEKYLDATQGA